MALQDGTAKHSMTDATVLRDGMPLNDLFDLKNRSVSMRLLTDPEIFELEMDRLFGRTWLALAHESEIPKNGDFVVRQMGLDNVLVVRKSDKLVNVLLNACTHRGMELERAESGTAGRFRCPYHGWVFDRDGRFVGAPCAEEFYGDCLDKPSLGLKQARVEIFAGIIFATWDQAAPKLDDFLGGFKLYLSLMFKRTISGLESVGPPQRWIIPGNWKCAAEQFAGDAYHSLTLHGSLFELAANGEPVVPDATPITGINVASPRGHGLLCRNMRLTAALQRAGGDQSGAESQIESLRKAPPFGVPADKVDDLVELYSEEELGILANYPPIAGQIFPNFAVMCADMVSAENGGSGPLITIRTWNPRGPNEIEAFSWTLVERGASEKLRRHTRRTTIQSFGSSGMIEQDDAETWPAQTRVARGLHGRQQWLRYAAQSEPVQMEGWPDDGLIFSGITKDDNQWAWWSSYIDFMTNRAW